MGCARCSTIGSRSHAARAAIGSCGIGGTYPASTRRCAHRRGRTFRAASTRRFIAGSSRGAARRSAVTTSRRRGCRCYVDGCRQDLHGDLPHGPWAFVYSLTNWRGRAFRGGETLMLRDEVLDYWDGFRSERSIEEARPRARDRAEVRAADRVRSADPTRRSRGHRHARSARGPARDPRLVRPAAAVRHRSAAHRATSSHAPRISNEVLADRRRAAGRHARARVRRRSGRASVSACACSRIRPASPPPSEADRARLVREIEKDCCCVEVRETTWRPAR